MVYYFLTHIPKLESNDKYHIGRLSIWKQEISLMHSISKSILFL